MCNKPAPNQQADGENNRQNRQPILPRPPQRKQETHAQHNTSNLARDNVESAKDKQRADQRRAEVPGWQGDGADAALHHGDAAFVGIEGDGFDAAAGAARGNGVAELVEGDH